MRIHHPAFRQLRDERGIALPMALLALLILSTLVIAFALLATSEPLVATNQKMVAQARAVAESGLERAIWALDNPADPNGLPTSLATVPAPYDGSASIPISVNGTQVGVVFVTVKGPVQDPTLNPNERSVSAVGWVPTNTGGSIRAPEDPGDGLPVPVQGVSPAGLSDGGGRDQRRWQREHRLPC